MIQSNQDDSGAIAFEQVAAGVYRCADPETIWVALRYAVQTELMVKNPTIMILFIRIAEIYLAVQEDLAQRRSTAEEKEAAAIKLILEPPAQLRDAAYLPDSIESPGEMDLCWGEFLVTGKTEIVVRVIEVLDREDLTRQFIQEQLQSSDADSLSLDDSERTALAQAGITLGLEADGGPDVILSEGDIDILLWFGVKNGNETCSRILKALPEPKAIHVANKGAAIWSLQANAQQHGAIRLLCEEESARSGGFGRLLIRPN
ncbi:MAG: hypothetical protein VXZ82_20075 [Planctomycetota bacterium]|nr:hypothetical protein [Planctomycetota bacterium]